MINLQTRLELEISAQQWVDSIMSQYSITAAERLEESLIIWFGIKIDRLFKLTILIKDSLFFTQMCKP